MHPTDSVMSSGHAPFELGQVHVIPSKTMLVAWREAAGPSVIVAKFVEGPFPVSILQRSNSANTR